MEFSILVPAIVFFANVGIGSLVILRNPKDRSSLYFFAMSLSISLWAVANYTTELSEVDLIINQVANRLAYFFGLLAVYCFALFSFEYKRAGPRLRKSFRVLKYTAIVLFPLSISSLVAGEVDKQGQELVFTVGDLLPIYIIFLLLYLSSAILHQAIIAKKEAGLASNQARLIIWGASISAIGSVITNTVIPLLTDSYSVAKIGPLFTILLVYSVGYAIAKHKLFDIRLIVARSLAYIFLFAVSIGTYTIIVFILARNLIGDENSILYREVIPLSTAFLIALTYHPIKRFFDKLTNRFFYRDAYESQVLLDQLNKVLVGSLGLEELLASASQVVGKTIKSEFCLFDIREMNGAKRRLVGQGLKDFDDEDIGFVRSKTPSLQNKIIVVDELDEKDAKLQQMLRKHKIALIARLTDMPQKEVEGLGYIILGSKKSGNPYSSQDVKVLEIIADEMVIAIQNALRFEEIQNFAETLQGRVDEATRKLRKTNEKLKALDETKDEFISMASHQLRTPLTSVKGYVSMVMEGDAGKITKQQKQLLDQAFVSSQRMVYLIADLLNVSRLRTGKFVIEAKPTNLADVIEGELNQLTETAKARDLSLVYHKPKDFPVLNMDETKTRQVIMNFVDNAIYYTPHGGTIAINLEDKGKSIEFTVVDNGIGVPKSEQHHMFSKFYRAGNAKKARPDGTGLGLFMAKKVIVAQGGSVIFSSQEGKGSTFGFSFPKNKLPPETTKKDSSGSAPSILDNPKPTDEEPTEIKTPKTATKKTAKK